MKLSQNITVGLLFFGALFMIGFFTIVSKSGPFAPSGKQIVVFFNSVEGIKVGSTVTVIGVPGGSVESIDLIPVDKERKMVALGSPERVGQRVAITLEMTRELIFYENYSIDIKNASLLGGKVVSIDPGSAIKTIEPEDEEKSENKEGETPKQKFNEPITVLFISTGAFSGSALEQLLEKRKEQNFVELEGNSAGDPVAGLSELISENRANVRETMQNIRDITNKISKGRGTLGQLVNDDELHRNASTLIGDAQIVARELREGFEDQREQAPVNSFIRAVLTAF